MASADQSIVKATTGPAVPTPSYGPGGAFSYTTSCTIRIRATPRECLDAVLDTSSYPQWNRFCRHVTIDSQPPSSSSTNDTTTNLQLQMGTHFTFDVHMNLGPEEPVLPVTNASESPKGQAIALEVSVLEPISSEGEEEGPSRNGWRIAWRQRPGAVVPAWLLTSERVHEFVEVSSDGGGVETEYTCWETFYGPLAPVVRMTVAGKVQRGFEVWSKGLKWWVEEGKVKS